MAARLPVLGGIGLFVSLVAFEVVVGLLAEGEDHDHDEGGEIGKEEA